MSSELRDESDEDEPAAQAERARAATNSTAGFRMISSGMEVCGVVGKA
jgi:hypothetical protein